MDSPLVHARHREADDELVVGAEHLVELECCESARNWHTPLRPSPVPSPAGERGAISPTLGWGCARGASRTHVSGEATEVLRAVHVHEQGGVGLDHANVEL